MKKTKNVLRYIICKKRKKYEKLDLNNVTDKKKFWKTVQPFLSDKGNIIVRRW